MKLLKINTKKLMLLLFVFTACICLEAQNKKGTKKKLSADRLKSAKKLMTRVDELVAVNKFDEAIGILENVRYYFTNEELEEVNFSPFNKIEGIKAQKKNFKQFNDVSFDQFWDQNPNPEVFKEQKSTPTNTYATYIKEGKYYINNIDSTGFYHALQRINLSKDFTVELKIDRVTGGASGKTYHGLSFFEPKAKKFFHFIIRGDGYFVLLDEIANKVYGPGISPDVFLGDKRSHILKVEKEGNTYKLSINNREFYTSSKASWSKGEAYIGVNVTGKQEVALDFFKLDYVGYELILNKLNTILTSYNNTDYKPLDIGNGYVISKGFDNEIREIKISDIQDVTYSKVTLAVKINCKEGRNCATIGSKGKKPSINFYGKDIQKVKELHENLNLFIRALKGN